jgi:hypothetical protein
MLMSVAVVALLAAELQPEKRALRAVRSNELARTISGKQVQTYPLTPEHIRLQRSELFYRNGRHFGEFHGGEASGRYRIEGDAVCVTTGARRQCRIAVVDGQGRMWFVRSLDPANFEQVFVSEIPK